MQRSQVTDEEIDKFFIELRNRFERRLEDKGRGIFVSPLEILGAITQEFLETAEAIHTNGKASRSTREIEQELADIATASIFGIISLRHEASKPLQ